MKCVVLVVPHLRSLDLFLKCYEHERVQLGIVVSGEHENPYIRYAVSFETALGTFLMYSVKSAHKATMNLLGLLGPI